MHAHRFPKPLHSAVVQLVIVAAMVLGSVVPAPVAAAPVPQTFGGDPLNAFPMLFPELRTLPAPAWVREGVRVTYYGQSASFAQLPDGESSAGAGYMHHDIVAETEDAVVVSSSLYLDTGAGVTPSGVFGASFRPGYGDFWLNPAVLENAETVANDELAVVRMPTTIADQDYDAVRFEYHTDEAVTISMFDVVTGLLVYFRHTVGADAATTRQSSELYLVGRRRIKLPWQGKKAPAWVKQGSALDYTGTRAVIVAGAPSGQFLESASADIKLARPRWSAFNLVSYLGNSLTGASERVTGVWQLTGALWVPAEALRIKVRKPLLDRDPITGVEVSYVRNPGGSVTIREQGELFRIDNTYDRRSGQLIAVRIEVQTGLAVQVTELFAEN